MYGTRSGALQGGQGRAVSNLRSQRGRHHHALRPNDVFRQSASGLPRSPILAIACALHITSGIDGRTCGFEEIAARSLRARMTSGKALASAGRCYWRRQMVNSTTKTHSGNENDSGRHGMAEKEPMVVNVSKSGFGRRGELV